MSYFKVEDTIIIYNNKTMPQAIELKRIVENNKLFFSNIFGKNICFSFIKEIEDSLYIDDLDKFIKKIIDDNFYSDDLDKRLNDKKESLTVYLGYIIVEGLSLDKVKEIYSNDQDKEDAISTLGDSLYQKEIYEDILIKEYFDEFGTKEDFIEYFKTKKNTKVIMDKVKDKYRFIAYNFVLENIVEYLKDCGYFYPENMLEICGNIHFEMRELTISKFIEQDELNKRLKKLPKMSTLRLDRYFREFLKEIDPDGLLLEIYFDALRKRKIKLSKKYQGSYCVIKDGDVTLEVEETGTIKDFFTLSHEFMHYVLNTYNKNSIPLALEEFPSIFFEKYAIDFLNKKGYKKEQLEVLHDFRFHDMKEKSFGMLNFLIADIIDKSKGKEVDDKRLREYVTILNKVIEKRNEEITKEYGKKEDGSSYIEPIEIEEYIKKDIDDRTKSYFVGLIEYVEAFRYPISSYIAFKTYDEFKKDKNILDRVIDYMLYATNPTFKETTELFGLDKNYQELVDNIEKEKQKIIKKNNM